MQGFVCKARPMAAAVALSMVLAACSDGGTGPDRSFDVADAEAANRAATDAAIALASNEDAFLALSSATFSIFGPQILAPTEAVAAFELGASVQSVSELQRSAMLVSPQAVPVLPDDVLGNTYVWSIEEEHYVADATRTDAPEDGILIIYYATDPVLGQPVTPLSELGTIELRDRGSATRSTVDLTITQTAGETRTLADYTVSGSSEESAGGSSGSFEASGFVRGPNHRIDFDLQQEQGSTETGLTYDLDFVLTNAAQGVTLDLDHAFQMTGENAEAQMMYSVRHGANTVVFDVDGTLTGQTFAQQGEVRFNGTLVAVVNDGALTSPDGSELDDRATQAIASAFATGGILVLFASYIMLPFLFLF